VYHGLGEVFYLTDLVRLICNLSKRMMAYQKRGTHMDLYVSCFSIVIFILMVLYLIKKSKSREAKYAFALVSVSALFPIHKIVVEPFVRVMFGFPIRFFGELYITGEGGSYYFTPLFAFHRSKVVVSARGVSINIVNYFIAVAIVYFLLRFLNKVFCSECKITDNIPK